MDGWIDRYGMKCIRYMQWFIFNDFWPYSLNEYKWWCSCIWPTNIEGWFLEDGAGAWEPWIPRDEIQGPRLDTWLLRGAARLRMKIQRCAGEAVRGSRLPAFRKISDLQGQPHFFLRDQAGPTNSLDDQWQAHLWLCLAGYHSIHW